MLTDAPTTTKAVTLKRSLNLRSVVLFGLAYLAPMIVLGTFGVLAMKTNGTAPTAYLLALVALLFTARSYGKMSARFPVAGPLTAVSAPGVLAHRGQCRQVVPQDEPPRKGDPR